MIRTKNEQLAQGQTLALTCFESNFKDCPLRVIQELARHRDLATTQRYIDVSVDKLRNAVNLVGS